MSIAGSVNSLSSVGVSYISNPEDAIALASIVQLSVSDELSKYLKNELEAKSGLSDFIKNFSEIKAQLTSLLSQKITKVYPDLLKKTGTSSDSLSNLFNADGIRLGSTFEESNSVLQDLKDQGVNLSTTTEYPVLVEDKNSDGKVYSEQIQWFTPEINEFLGMILKGEPSSTYSNATVYTSIGANKTTVFTVFNGQKNLRVDEQSIKDSSAQLQDKYQNYMELFNKSIEKINSATNKLNEAIDGVSKSTLEQQKFLSDLRSAKQTNYDQEINNRRIDRTKFLNKLDENNQSRNNGYRNNFDDKKSIIQKNGSNKIEEISPMPDWLLINDSNKQLTEFDKNKNSKEHKSEKF